MSKQIQDAYIVAATRLPVGRRKGMLGHVRPDDMLAHAIRSVMAQAPGLDPALVEDVIVGCAMPEAEQGMNVARIGLLLAGLPNTVPGVTVNRFCASGLQTVAMAADRIRLGEADVMIAGGTETMSLMNQIMGNKIAMNPAIFEKEENYAIGFGMGITAEKVAAQWKISREDQDAFAVASNQKACAAIAAGHFQAEITPYPVTARVPNLQSGEVTVKSYLAENDEGPRSDSSSEGLARLRPVFAARGSVTAGNSSQMSDGAAAVLVVSEKILKQFNLKPLARFAGFSVAGVAPEIMGIGPVAAIPRLLKRAGIGQHEVDWIELNEAFAAQALAVIRELNLDPARVNPLGGAIALGHPLGATGTIRTATLLHGMQRTGQRYGMVTMCIGTGMGAAGLFEAIR
ncbi:MAG: acetyl-CoA C-acyltransferase [Candidatus Accumulibacter phosphatis]|jgi:acetyl-CoA acyltransferase|uniref:acetyl-CoA C-acyltransferase n=2 Tax=Candidatus Accumulibacter TaxID=327159 RepID=A0A080LVQ0_9PROT|nr:MULTISPECIES: acetyl-CoA C-acyltransferase [Candidatus Accumulibacter]KFB72706.1 MAG: 3-ketoacyl-CoA thiolase [Candidatus Accumulibacter phosphatis]MBL8409248.1 acetyl-CoA C-acyltransferase [Accumulibacter sp.]NMQ03918.1 acetyl-CoA C-acyltransferase [Candidatus Accumulibacter contiguus]